MVRGSQAARSMLVQLKDGVLGVASAERRLAQDTVHAASAQDKLATAAKRAHAELKAAANAMRAQSVGTGISPLTGGSVSRAGVGPIEGIRRAQLLYGIQRSGVAGYEELAARKAAEAAEGGGTGGNHALGRFGKRIGGVFGAQGAKIGESIGMTPALGAVAIGAVAAGIALNEFGKEVESAKDEVRHIAEIRTDIRDGIRAAFASANGAAIGEAKTNRGAIASLIGSGQLQRGQELAKGLGADGLQGIGILNQKKLMDNPKVIEAMRLAVGTGQITASQFATTIGGARGLAGAGGSAESVAKAVLGRNGSLSVDVGAAGKNFATSQYGRAYEALDRAEEFRSKAALGRFAAGGTEGGIREEAARIASPETAARMDVQRRLDENQKVLDDVAANQGKMTALWDAIANRGDSASNTRDRTKRQNAEAVMP